MFEHETHKPDDDDLVDRATATLRDAAMPEGPGPELLAKTWSALARAEALGNHHDPIPITSSNRRRFLTMKNVSRLAIAAVLILSIGVLIYTGAGGGGMAFADVLQKVNAVHSVRFKADATVALPNFKEPTKTTITMMVVGNRMRQEMFGGSTVMDFESGQVVSLVPLMKSATKMHLDNMPKQAKQQNILENFRKMHADSGKSVGRKEIGGQSLEGYKVDQDGQSLTVWADPKTRLPARIEATMDYTMAPKAEIVMRDFEWDANIPESLMSLDVPAGYDVQEMTFDASKPTETDLVDTFRALAGTQDGGKYPDRFDITGFAGSVGAAEAKAQITKDPKDKVAGNAVMQKMMKLMRGLTFVQRENGSDFHYAGKGATFGQANRPIFWYKPAGSDTYHVIDADLTVHRDVAAADLPQIESQELKAFGKPFNADNPGPAKPRQ